MLPNARIGMIILAVTGLELKAQPNAGPCYPDCENTYWTDIIESCPLVVNGCTVVAKYRVRYACDEWYDVFLESYTMTGPQCNPANFPPASRALLHQAVVGALLASACTVPPVENLPIPGPGECRERWRVSYGSCWMVVPSPYQPGGGQSLWTPCSNEICCLDRYLLCRDIQGNLIATRAAVSPPSGCPPEGMNQNCFSACGP
jgi:hypothetical protein